MYKKAFTLAEIMIVLMVIGILTAILLPSARNAMPNEDLMKFKKAHNAFYTAIRELVISDKYFLDGDLATKADGTQIDGTHTGDTTYLCQAMGDVLNTKKVNCVSAAAKTDHKGIWSPKWATATTPFEKWFDSFCTGAQSSGVKNVKPGEGITLSDDTVIYESNVEKFFINTYEDTYNYDDNDFLIMYKVFCIEIDGISNKGGYGTCVDTCAFGYGVRRDGKIVNGARAQEWLQKSIQDK